MAVATSALAALALAQSLAGLGGKGRPKRKRGRPANPKHHTLLTGPETEPKRPRGKPARYNATARPVVWLEIEMSIPIHAEVIWNGLSFTRALEKGSIAWTGKVRGSLVQLDDRDGRFLFERLTAQATQPKPYPIDEQDTKKPATHTVNRPDKVVTVSVPEDSRGVDEMPAVEQAESRESIKVQALLAQIGAAMGMSIWIPRADRGGVLREWKDNTENLVERLPLNYDDTTLRTTLNR